MKTKVLYHDNCPDGFAAAWAAWARLGDAAEYIPCSYGSPPPDVAGSDVYILDFSFKRDVMIELTSRAEHVTVLDHHITAEADLSGLADEVPNLIVVFDMKMSGATLAWRHFHYGLECWLTQYAEDRDLWKHELPQSREVNAYLASLPRTFEAYSQAFRRGLSDVASMGEGCLAWVRYYVNSVKKAASRGEFLGHQDIPIVNAPYPAISEVVGELAEDALFAVGWHVRPDGKVVYSLRSKEYDVATLAVNQGGGGHRKAAGFTSEIYPWFLDGKPRL